MKLTIHPDASAEIELEARYYEGQAPGLGAAFLGAIDDAVQRVALSPQHFPSDERGLKKCVVERFPFTVRFRQLNGGIEVLVVRHDARHPDYGSERL